jgi:hypothetical protein
MLVQWCHERRCSSFFAPAREPKKRHYRAQILGLALTQVVTKTSRSGLFSASKTARTINIAVFTCIVFVIRGAGLAAPALRRRPASWAR